MSYLYHFGLAALTDGSGDNAKDKIQARAKVVSNLIDKLKLDNNETTTAGNIAKAINNIAGNQGGYYKMRVYHPTKKGADGLDMSINVDFKPEYMLYDESRLLPLIVKAVCAQRGDSEQKQTLLARAPTLCMTNQERLLNFINDYMFRVDFAIAKDGRVTADLYGLTHADESKRVDFLNDFKAKSNARKDIDLTFASENAVNFYSSYSSCPKAAAGMDKKIPEDEFSLFSVSEIRTDVKKRNITPPPFPSENYGCVDGEDLAAFYQCA